MKNSFDTLTNTILLDHFNEYKLLEDINQKQIEDLFYGHDPLFPKVPWEKAYEKIKMAVYRMYSVYPFMGTFERNLSYVPNDPRINTAAVDKNGNLYYNSDFIDKLTLPQVAGIIIHELSHLAMGDLFYEKTNQQLWNIATDLINNWYITQDIKGLDGIQLPPGILMPDENGIVRHAGPIAIPDNLIIDLNDSSSEEVYEQLKRLTKEMIDELEKGHGDIHIVELPKDSLPPPPGNGTPPKPQPKGKTVIKYNPGDEVIIKQSNKRGKIVSVGEINPTTGVQDITVEEIEDITKLNTTIDDSSTLSEAVITITNNDVVPISKSMDPKNSSGQSSSSDEEDDTQTDKRSNDTTEDDSADQSINKSDLDKRDKELAERIQKDPKLRDHIVKQAEEAGKHITKSDLSDEQEKEYWKQQVKETKKLSSGSGAGNINNSALANAALNKIKPTINWQQALKNFLTRPGETFQTWMRPSKRGFATQTYLPKSVSKPKLEKFVIAIDTSGSCMSTDIYSKFIGETVNLFSTMDNTEGVVLFWDTKVSVSIDINSSNYNKLLHVNPTSGGTTFSCVGQYLVAQNKIKPAGVIVFTDGEFSDTEPFVPTHIGGKKVTYIFFLLPGGKKSIVKKYGKVYPITGK